MNEAVECKLKGVRITVMYRLSPKSWWRKAMLSRRCENRYFQPAAALAACVLGWVLCPFIYVIAIALGPFEPALWFIALPPLLISSGYLLFRFLGKPKEPASSGVWLIAEILSWLVIVAFLMIASNSTLFSTTFERIGELLMFFLLASLFSLPITLIRKSALQQRLMKLPGSVITPVLVLVVSTSAAIVAIYLLSPNSVWR